MIVLIWKWKTMCCMWYTGISHTCFWIQTFVFVTTHGAYRWVAWAKWFTDVLLYGVRACSIDYSEYSSSTQYLIDNDNEDTCVILVYCYVVPVSGWADNRWQQHVNDRSFMGLFLFLYRVSSVKFGFTGLNIRNWNLCNIDVHFNRRYSATITSCHRIQEDFVKPLLRHICSCI